MEWSPQHAMKAYLHTLHLCKLHTKAVGSTQGTSATTRLVEPKCMEFISALAAGKQARLIVEITTAGVTSMTVALAVAAKYTGGRFICVNINPSRQDDNNNNVVKLKEITRARQLLGSDLEHVVEFVHGPSDPCEAIMQYKNVDFAVIDCEFKDHARLFKIMNVNPRGCIVVHHRRSQGASFAEIVKKKIGVECVTLPIGEGMELTRIGSGGGGGGGRGDRGQSRRSRRFKRFHVTFED